MSELIYKQDAMDLVKDVCDAIMSGCNSHYDSETRDEVYDDILEVDAILKCNKEIRIALGNLPSAEPETKRAVWALHTYMPHHHYCTHCKKDSPYNKRWSYCPNCGYEMEEYV